MRSTRGVPSKWCRNGFWKNPSKRARERCIATTIMLPLPARLYPKERACSASADDRGRCSCAPLPAAGGGGAGGGGLDPPPPPPLWECSFSDGCLGGGAWGTEAVASSSSAPLDSGPSTSIAALPSSWSSPRTTSMPAPPPFSPFSWLTWLAFNASDGFVSCSPTGGTAANGLAKSFANGFAHGASSNAQSSAFSRTLATGWSKAMNPATECACTSTSATSL
mmetsp:Transcript_7463/g.14028  ORF Transcript_7463/g.14028 Transcript_7463/m.14028 type:complete len:222 (+) Transcript_7463:1670-2335(+)